MRDAFPALANVPSLASTEGVSSPAIWCAPSWVASCLLMAANLDTWFAHLDRFADVPLMEKGRQQSPMLEAEDLFA